MNILTPLEEITITIIGIFIFIIIVQLLFQNQRRKSEDSNHSDLGSFTKLIIPTFLLVIGLGIFYRKISIEISLILVFVAIFLKIFLQLNQKNWVRKKKQVNDVFEIDEKLTKKERITEKET